MSTNPANLLGVDYRRPPRRRLGDRPIVDSHLHLRGGSAAMECFLPAARLYGVRHFLSMTFIELLDEVRGICDGQVDFIAIPDYRQWKRTRRFQQAWRRDVRRFADAGSKVCKFWAAPRALAEHGLTLADPWLRPVIDAALDRGMGFMVHVGDPDVWYATRYADSSRFGVKQAAHEQLEWFLNYVAPMPVVGAHFVGHPEDLDHLDGLLARYPHLMLDTSATKWIAREVSRHRPSRVRRFFRAHRERILFGSDLVIDPQFDFDHYASRYWVQQMLWGSDYRGPSPIMDPDAAPPAAPIRGIGLSDELLNDIYHGNFHRLMGRLPMPPRRLS